MLGPAGTHTPVSRPAAAQSPRGTQDVHAARCPCSPGTQRVLIPVALESKWCVPPAPAPACPRQSLGTSAPCPASRGCFPRLRFCPFPECSRVLSPSAAESFPSLRLSLASSCHGPLVQGCHAVPNGSFPWLAKPLKCCERGAALLYIEVLPLSPGWGQLQRDTFPSCSASPLLAATA